jgi:hypothetical protein
MPRRNKLATGAISGWRRHIAAPLAYGPQRPDRQAAAKSFRRTGGP